MRVGSWRRVWPIAACVCALALAAAGFAQEVADGAFSAEEVATALGSAFTYQGKLTDSGSAATGSYDMTFKLFDALSSGSQVGSTVTKTSVAVAGGLFTVELDFGTSPFAGQARWLELAVRPAGSGSYTTLVPRQPLDPTPYALYSRSGVATDVQCSGYAGDFIVSNAGDAAAAIHAESSGTGPAGEFNNSAGRASLRVSGHGQTRNNASLQVDNSDTTSGMCMFITNASPYATGHFSNSGSGQVLFLTNGGTNSAGAGGGDFIQARNHSESALQFAVQTTGTVLQAGAANGLVKAAWYGSCKATGSTTTRSFTTVVGAPVPYVSDIGGENGVCYVHFGFDLSNRYYVAQPVATGGSIGTVWPAGAGQTYIEVSFWDGGFSDGYLMVLVY